MVSSNFNVSLSFSEIPSNNIVKTNFQTNSNIRNMKQTFLTIYFSLKKKKIVLTNFHCEIKTFQKLNKITIPRGDLKTKHPFIIVLINSKHRRRIESIIHSDSFHSRPIVRRVESIIPHRLASF